ncbi:MAG: hypothetical protein ACLS4Z_02325 [Christensenellaceae bacterium]
MLNLLISLQEIFDSAETWVTALIAMIGATGIGSAITGIITHAISKRMAKRDANVDAVAELAAEKAANKVVKKIVGKSINVDVSAEVNKTLDKRLNVIETHVMDTHTTSRNIEIGVAGIALAQSKSRLLSEEEKAAMQLSARQLPTMRRTAARIVEPAKSIAPTRKKPTPETRPRNRRRPRRLRWCP